MPRGESPGGARPDALETCACSGIAPASDNGRGIAHPQEAGEPPAADQGLTDA